MNQTVLIATGSHLCHNPRVIKEATALHDAGYDVEVLGGWIDPGLKARDKELIRKLKFRYRPLHDLTQQPALRLWLRLRGRLAQELHARTGRETHWQLGHFTSSLCRALHQSKADLVIAHSEQALWALCEILSPHPSPLLAVDMEDWFSEDLPPETRRHRPVKLLRSLEQTLLRNAAHTTCTSRAMSNALAGEYQCPPPLPIYNAFPWADREGLDGRFKDRKDRAQPSIHWYSQTLGYGRGLEDLLAALPLIECDAEVHLRGKPANGFDNWLAARVPDTWRRRIFIHDLVSNGELLSRIAEHDIGFSGETRSCRSRDLTVTNKILHYLLGGLPIVASDTEGQREVEAQSNGAVFLYASGNTTALAKRLNALLSSAGQLTTAKQAALIAVQQTFCWEKQVAALLESVKNALESPLPQRTTKALA